jgi:hypothetical protein
MIRVECSEFEIISKTERIKTKDTELDERFAVKLSFDLGKGYRPYLYSEVDGEVFSPDIEGIRAYAAVRCPLAFAKIESVTDKVDNPFIQEWVVTTYKQEYVSLLGKRINRFDVGLDESIEWNGPSEQVDKVEETFYQVIDSVIATRGALNHYIEYANKCRMQKLLDAKRYTECDFGSDCRIPLCHFIHPNEASANFDRSDSTRIMKFIANRTFNGNTRNACRKNIVAFIEDLCGGTLFSYTKIAESCTDRTCSKMHLVASCNTPRCEVTPECSKYRHCKN